MAKNTEKQAAEAVEVEATQAPVPVEAEVTEKKAVEMEEIRIPRAAVGEEPNLFVSVNGKNWLLPKGKTSKVPKYVADEIKRSWKAQGRWDDIVNDMQSADAALN